MSKQGELEQLKSRVEKLEAAVISMIDAINLLMPKVDEYAAQHDPFSRPWLQLRGVLTSFRDEISSGQK